MKTKFNIYEVFTPTQPANVNFVDRDKINNQLVDAIRTPGMQIVIYGHTGSGKTTLIDKKLNQLYSNVIETQCTKGTTIEQLILEAFDTLDKFYVNEKTKEINNGISANLKLKYLEIRGKRDLNKKEKSERVVPIQLTDKKLAEFIGEINGCWKIEDFHKVDKEHKIRLSQIMKVFMDVSKKYKTTKVIAIGAVGTGKEVVEYDKEMEERISEVFVPLMSVDELEKIIEKGEEMLNVEFTKEIKNKIVVYSNGLGSVCHRLCLNICTNNEIYETVEEKKVFKNEDLEKAINDYITQKSATLKSVYDKSTRTSKGSKYNVKQIFQAILDIRKEEVTGEEIHRKLQEQMPSYPISTLTSYLKQLITIEREEILRFNKDANTYFFSNPFQKAFIELTLSKEKKVIQLGNERISPEEIRAYLQAKKEMYDEFDDEY